MNNSESQYLNSIYIRKKYGFDEIKNKSVIINNDALIVYIKDETGKTNLHVIESPSVEYYKSVIPKDYPELSVPRDTVEKFECKYTDRDRVLSREVNKLSDFYHAIKQGDKYNFINREVYNHPDLYMADIDIESYKKNMFIRKHGTHYNPIKKAFMDIEVRTYDLEGSIDSDMAMGTINIISQINEWEKTIYIHLLTDRDDPQVTWVKENKSAFIRWMMQDPEMEFAKGFSFSLMCHDTEPELLVAYAKTVKKTKADFVGIWNMRFDIPYIMNRLIRHGIEPKDVFSADEIPEELRTYYFRKAPAVDPTSGSRKNPSRLFDWCKLTSQSQFYDMMSLYSILRIRTLFPSYKLDDIVEREIGKKKLDLHAKGLNIRTVELKDFKTFIKYNVIDTGRCMELEQKTQDLDKLVLQSGNSPIEKFDKVSLTSKNTIMHEEYLKGNVIGNNTTYDVHEFVPGAMVASPLNILIKGIPILGKRSHVYENVVDLDLKAMYPMVMVTYNILKTTIYGRIMKVYNKKNNEVISADGSLLSRYIQTIDASIFEVGNTYFGLPKMTDLINNIGSELDKHIA